MSYPRFIDMDGSILRRAPDGSYQVGVQLEEGGPIHVLDMSSAVRRSRAGTGHCFLEPYLKSVLEESPDPLAALRAL
jgi:hypothetical protein